MIRIGARLGTTLSSQVCEIPKTPHPVPQNRGKTSNVQHRTSNAEVSEDSRCHSMFSVGCSILDVLPASWRASTIPESRIGTMNPIVLVLVLVLVLETKLAGRGRVRERGRGRRDASWRGSGCGPRRVRLVRPSGVIFLRTKLIRRAFNS